VPRFVSHSFCNVRRFSVALDRRYKEARGALAATSEIAGSHTSRLAGSQGPTLNQRHDAASVLKCAGHVLLQRGGMLVAKMFKSPRDVLIRLE